MKLRGILAAGLLAAASPAFAADIPAPSKIDAVTVFPSGAEVMRVIKVKLAAGEHTLLVNDFTADALPASIRVETAAADKLQIGSVDFSRVSLTSTDPAVLQSARKKLEDELEALSDQRAAEDNVIKSAETQKVYLENLTRLPQAPAPADARGPREDWQALTSVISKGMNEAAKTILDARLKQRQLDRAIADLRKQISTEDIAAERTGPQHLGHECS